MDQARPEESDQPRELNVAPYALIALMVLAAALVVAAIEARPTGAEVAMLATGTGDCAVVRVRCGRTLLIDGGGQGQLNSEWGVLMPYLLSAGVRSLDAIILTGPTANDVGGIPTVLAEVPVGAVFMAHETAVSDFGRKIRVMCASLEVPVYDLVEGQRFDIGGHGSVTVHLWEGAGEHPAVGLRVERVRSSALLVNSNGKENVSAIMAAPPDRAEVMRLLENGEAWANPDALLAAVAPAVAVISRPFRGRTKSDPTSITTVRSLQALGAMVYRTDIDGTVMVRLTPRGARVSTYLGS